MESSVDKVYPLLANVKTLDSKVIKNIVGALRTSVSADEALAVLRATVARWQLKTKGVVPFELEATFESIVYGVFSVDAVALAGGDCMSQFYSLFCRSVKQVLVNDLSGAVVAVSQEVMNVAKIVDSKVESLVETAVDAAAAVEASAVAAVEAVAVEASAAVQAAVVEASAAVQAAVVEASAAVAARETSAGEAGNVVSEVLAAVASEVSPVVAAAASQSAHARRSYARRAAKFVA